MMHPKYKQAGKEIIKLRENLELIDLGFELYMELSMIDQTRREEGYLLEEIQKLVEISLSRIEVIKGNPSVVQAMQTDPLLKVGFDWVISQMNNKSAQLQHWI